VSVPTWGLFGKFEPVLIGSYSQTFEISFSEFMQISKQAFFFHGEVDDTDELIWGR